ncbi:MAG: aminopeptidase M24 [Cenarchaeum symbiont of Oopsacas minuta]|nr:aminopeptidase M24 [Cenarchaeum symbiont of Oopsacas minuta]
MKSRRKKLLDHAKKAGFDTIVALDPENLFYMTGFWGEAIGVLDSSGAQIIAPALEATRAKAESINCHIFSSDRGSTMITDLASILDGKKPCTDCTNYTTMMMLQKKIHNLKHDISPFTKSRIIKDSFEIKILRKASSIIDGMFELCAKSMKKGQNELQLQSILMMHAMERGMFDTGYASTLNPLIIAGGPNGALPHAQATERKFKTGDLVVVDLTLRYMGYVSDSTRTFGIGKISKKVEKIYDIVYESQRLGLKAAKPRALCSTVDNVCRKYITKAGYGKEFIHSTGHGLGLDVHETPTISVNSDTKLAKNMAITIEPGIYVSKKFGIRIEDSLIVGTSSPVMHKFTKKLITV